MSVWKCFSSSRYIASKKKISCIQLVLSFPSLWEPAVRSSGYCESLMIRWTAISLSSLSYQACCPLKKPGTYGRCVREMSRVVFMKSRNLPTLARTSLVYARSIRCLDEEVCAGGSGTEAWPFPLQKNLFQPGFTDRYKQFLLPFPSPPVPALSLSL